jgi:2-C-methyl-D-erythritol 2,4-cyclodiphosphate synthase
VTRLRVGQGFDVHAFASGRPLRLGGVLIPYGRGLAGHSDGDALLHAVVDALLGAAGRGDIGQRFPSSEPRLRDADSRGFVREVVAELRADGWEVVNLDTTVIAQSPPLAPHAAVICASLAELLGVDPHSVGLKAKTADHLGALGREEGLAALAVVLLEQG